MYRITNSWIKYVYALMFPNFIKSEIHLLLSFKSSIKKDNTSKQDAGIRTTVFLHHVKKDIFQILGTNTMVAIVAKLVKTNKQVFFSFIFFLQQV